MTAPTIVEFELTSSGSADAPLPSAVRLGRVLHKPFSFRTRRVTSGSLAVEETRCTDEVHMRMPDEHGYLVGIPVRGALRIRYRGQDLDLGPGRAAVLAPPAEATVDTVEQFDVVVADIGSVALEDMLEALLGRSVRRPLPLAASLSLNSPAGRSWAADVRLITDVTAKPTSLSADPISAEPMQDHVMVQLLFATDHPHHEALDASVPTWGPRAIRRCIDYIEAFPDQPLTPGRLATVAGLSIRALAGSWIRHRDVPSWQDIERVRLGRAHADLEFFRPGETTVAAVARSWGFGPPRFVAAYGTRFGRSPAQTLRGPAFA
ncbi:AraC family transcriptional regulator [Amycolatopsis sp. RTGN1]|uniref:AraC family transcriptional regulator n=1 Tax=Amycolatopsis ponsaeliensis TaxID=2992142 RepID=UPI00254AFE42|nr:AraC family transcriptional regulator [Amycolatopsis sp. RTGN1]